MAFLLLEYWAYIRAERRIQMPTNALIGRWAKESLAMMMVGDALVTLIDPQRHCRLWMKGPEKWQQFIGMFVQHPCIARGLALGELGLGKWLAEKQRPVAT